MKHVTFLRTLFDFEETLQLKSKAKEHISHVLYLTQRNKAETNFFCTTDKQFCSR